MRPTKEEKKKKKIFQLQQELKESRDKIKSLENKLSTSERKRKSLLVEKESDKKKEDTEPSLYSLLNAINTLNLSFH
jgi:predicted  nucleic acid-binding Zn-ribbon protein